MIRKDADAKKRTSNSRERESKKSKKISQRGERLQGQIDIWPNQMALHDVNVSSVI